MIICSGESLQGLSPNRVLANLPRSAPIQLEKGRSPPRPRTPLGPGEQPPALRLVSVLVRGNAPRVTSMG
jgi:hypothetical protein